MLYDWLIQHSAGVMIVLATLSTLLVAVTIWLAIGELRVDKRLGPVGVVGPCRTFGPDGQECIRQSRLIVRSCVTHPACRHDLMALIRRTLAEGGVSVVSAP